MLYGRLPDGAYTWHPRHVKMGDILRHRIALQALLVVQQVRANLLQVVGWGLQSRARHHADHRGPHGNSEGGEVEGAARREGVEDHVCLSQHLKETIVTQQSR